MSQQPPTSSATGDSPPASPENSAPTVDIADAAAQYTAELAAADGALDEAYAEYRVVMDAAWAEYQTARDAAKAKYHAARDAAHAAEDAARAKYREAKASARGVEAQAGPDTARPRDVVAAPMAERHPAPERDMLPRA